MILTPGDVAKILTERGFGSRLEGPSGPVGDVHVGLARALSVRAALSRHAQTRSGREVLAGPTKPFSERSSGTGGGSGIGSGSGVEEKRGLSFWAASTVLGF